MDDNNVASGANELINKKQYRLYLATVILVAIMAKIIFAAMAVNPGRGDPSHYYVLAENLSSGRGFVTDYIGHYMSVPDQITHYANDYWMPLTSVIITLFMYLLGNSMFAALLPSIIASLILSYITYRLARFYTGSDFTGYISAGLILVAPSLFQFSLMTDSTIYYVLFAGLSIYCLISGFEKPRLLIWSAIFAGLANLTRQDGVLILLAIIISIVIYKPYRTAAKFVIIAVAAYLIVMSPLVVLNAVKMGKPLPAGALKTIFFTEYFDLYDYTGNISFSKYLNSGIANILFSKFKAGMFNVKQAYLYLGGFIWAFAIAGVGRWLINTGKAKINKAFIPPALLVILLYFVYTFVCTFISNFGGFLRSGMVMIPFVIIIAVETMRSVINSERIRWLLVIAVSAMLAFQGIYSTLKMFQENAGIERYLTEIKSVILHDSPNDEDIVLMTRAPWEANQTTGFKAVQIPEGGPDLIYEVARRYDVDYLLAPFGLKHFADVYTGAVDDERFVLVKEFPLQRDKLYRIQSLE